MDIRMRQQPRRGAGIVQRLTCQRRRPLLQTSSEAWQRRQLLLHKRSTAKMIGWFCASAFHNRWPLAQDPPVRRALWSSMCCRISPSHGPGSSWKSPMRTDQFISVILLRNRRMLTRFRRDLPASVIVSSGSKAWRSPAASAKTRCSPMTHLSFARLESVAV